MSFTLGPEFTIPGYTTLVAPDYDTECDAPLVAADDVVGHPVFWAWCLAGPLGAEGEAAGAFDVAPGQWRALAAVVDDPERWPVVSLRFEGEAWLRIVHRNFQGDVDIDYVQERPGHPARVVASVDTGVGSELTWAELREVAAQPDERLTWAQRLILLLPLLGEGLPADAAEVLDHALAEVGAGNREALVKELMDLLG